MTQQQTTQQAVWKKILAQVRSQLIQPALAAAGITDVEWTEFRWDALDITASWPKPHPRRNVHAWLTGEWPTYRLNFEGAAWEDDWGKLKRRVRFFRGSPGVLALDPPWDNPDVRIPHPPDMPKQVIELVQQVQKAELYDLEWKYDLQPDPRQADISER